MASRESHWILIRGLAREARHWGAFPEQLQMELGSGARVDAIDLPGTGRFSEMRSPISIPEIAEFTREKFLEIRRRQREAGLNAAMPTYLFAISLGGMIATAWLDRWPQDFAGVVLINTSFKGYSPFYRRLSPGALKNIFGAIRDRRDVIARERHVLALVSNMKDRARREELAQAWADIHVNRPISFENFMRQLVAASRYRPSEVRPPIPVLMLNSERDRMVHPTCSKVIASRWGVDLHCHPWAGHDLPLDDADWVIQQIKAWLCHVSIHEAPARPRP